MAPRGTDLAHLCLIALDRQSTGGVAQERCHPGSRRGIEVAVVSTPSQAGQGRGRRRVQGRPQLLENDSASPTTASAFQHATGLAEGPGLAVDGQRGLVAEVGPGGQRTGRGEPRGHR